MFDELNDYNSVDHFFFNEKTDLREACNAPKDAMGVYLVYSLKNGRKELIYIGSSGKVNQKGQPKIRKNGMYDRIVNGKQFDAPRKVSWKNKIQKEQIEALDIYWYETFDHFNSDIPTVIEGILLQKHFNLFGTLPKWNKEF